jgi:hypothetical protein
MCKEEKKRKNKNGEKTNHRLLVERAARDRVTEMEQTPPNEKERKKFFQKINNK